MTSPFEEWYNKNVEKLLGHNRAQLKLAFEAGYILGGRAVPKYTIAMQNSRSWPVDANGAPVNTLEPE